MRFRVGLALGFGAGYVLGAKAGRERYEQILATAQNLVNNQNIQRAIEQVGQGAADVVGSVVQHRVGSPDEPAVPEAPPAPTTPAEPEVEASTARDGGSNGKI